MALVSGHAACATRGRARPVRRTLETEWLRPRGTTGTTGAPRGTACSHERRGEDSDYRGSVAAACWGQGDRLLRVRGHGGAYQPHVAAASNHLSNASSRASRYLGGLSLRNADQTGDRTRA